MPSGIYLIRNTVNGRVYVGSAVCFASRWRLHRRTLRNGTHRNIKLARAYAKYGEQSFVYAPLLLCSPENLLLYEQRAMAAFDAVESGYNISPTAGSPRGCRWSPEARERVSVQRKGRTLSPEHRANLMGKPSPRKGAVLSAETREKISAKLRGRKLTPEHVANAVAALKGKPRRQRSDKGIKRGPVKK